MATQDGPLDDRQRHAKDREASVAGSLSDMGVADLVQTLELGRKSGVLHLKARTGARATCHFRNGRVVDCELGGALQGEEAFYRILRWHEGGFAIEFKPIEHEERIQLPTQALLLQGMRRIDEWGRAVEQLPPLDRRLEVDVARLGERLSKIPDGANALVRLFDGCRTLAQVIEVAPGDDLVAADTIARLVADGILIEPGGGATAPAALPAAEPPRGAALEPRAPGPEQGGVDWFAGPVGPEAVVAPATAWAPTPDEAGPSRGGRPEGGGDWLAPPLPAPPPSVAAPPAAPARTSPPRPAAGFSIPVPPPGSLPPPPSVAETLARYRVVPRPTAPPAPEPAAAPIPSASERVAPEPERLEVVPARVEPVAAPPPEARPAARPTAKSIRQRLDPASLPLQLEEPPELSRPPTAPRRSAVPYLAVGALVVAAIAAGTVLQRRPPLGARPPVAGAAPEEAPAAPADAAAPRPAPADEHEPAPADAAPAEAPAARADPAGEPPPSAPEPPPKVAPPAVAAAAPAGPTAPAGDGAAAPAPKPEEAVADARKLLAAADRKYAAGRYPEAIADYRRAIALRSTPAARVALARALYDAHRDAEAMRELDQVIGANPHDASAWLLRGDIHQGEGRAEQAREAYQRFLEIEPKGEQARVVRMILGRDPQ